MKDITYLYELNIDMTYSFFGTCDSTDTIYLWLDTPLPVTGFTLGFLHKDSSLQITTIWCKLANLCTLNGEKQWGITICSYIPVVDNLHFSACWELSSLNFHPVTFSLSQNIFSSFWSDLLFNSRKSLETQVSRIYWCNFHFVSTIIFNVVVKCSTKVIVDRM